MNNFSFKRTFFILGFFCFFVLLLYAQKQQTQNNWVISSENNGFYQNKLQPIVEKGQECIKKKGKKIERTQENYHQRIIRNVPKKKEQKKEDLKIKDIIETAGGFNLFFGGSYLYWQSKQNGLDVGHLVNSSNPSASEGRTIEMDFDYHPSFKATIGMLTEMYDWSLSAGYTRFHVRDEVTTNVHGDLDSIVTYWLNTTVTNATRANARWHFSYDIFDLEISHPFSIGKKFLYYPHIGLRGGWIDQRYNLQYTINSLEVKSHNASKSSLIGPRIGIWLHNLLRKKKFRLFGHIASSLLYQDFKVNLKQDNASIPTLLQAQFRKKEKMINPNLEMALGIRWGNYLKNKRIHMDISASYDFSIYWNQNLMKPLKDQAASSNTTKPGDLLPGNLLLHGLTISICINL